MRVVAIVLVLFAASLAAAPAQSPAPSPRPAPSPTLSAGQPSAIDLARERIDTMLRTGHAAASWFSESFLAQVSVAQIDAGIAQLKSALGSYKNVESTPGAFVAHFEKGTDEVFIHLDAGDKINGILFRPPKVQAGSLEDALRGLRPSRGTLSYVIVQGRSERAALDPSASLAVGSAFKLAVLAALRDQIAHGQRRWSDVVPLDGRWKTLPSGVLRTWPDGTPLTLATYAAEMISISDNTAADALVRLTGAALAPYAGDNAPFLTTREMFILKSKPGAALRAAYLDAKTAAARSAAVRRADVMPLPVLADLVTEPIPEIEWHYSVRELCRLMARVADLPLMSINPGAADASDFRHVAYKGGSDFGILNLTTQVTTKSGATYCFSATLNDREKVDDKAFISAYGVVLSALSRT